MSNWRIVNPALEPARVEFETGDEQAALTQFAARDAGLRGFKLLKSDDEGKTWAEVEARAPDASAPAGGSSGASSGAARGQVDPEKSDDGGDKSKAEKREKASK